MEIFKSELELAFVAWLGVMGGLLIGSCSVVPAQRPLPRRRTREAGGVFWKPASGGMTAIQSSPGLAAWPNALLGPREPL